MTRDSTAAIVRRLVPVAAAGPHAVVAALTLVLVVAGGAFVYVDQIEPRRSRASRTASRLTRRDLATLTLRVDQSGPGADEVRVEVNGVAVPLREDGDDSRRRQPTRCAR